MCCCHGFFLHNHSAYCVRDSKGKMVSLHEEVQDAQKTQLSVHTYEWRPPHGLGPRMTPVTIWCWVMYCSVTWHFFPRGLHWAWLFVLRVKCKEPLRCMCQAIWTAEPSGIPGIWGCKFSHKDFDVTSEGKKPRKSIWWNWTLSTLHLTQKLQARGWVHSAPQLLLERQREWRSQTLL